jgi:hypothetical protein
MLFYLILYDFTNYGIRDLIYGNNEENGLLEAVFIIAKLINSFIFLDHLETIKETLFFFPFFFFSTVSNGPLRRIPASVKSYDIFMLHMVLIVCTHGATSQTNKIS